LKKTAYIGLGSNLGDGLRTLQQAWREVGNAAEVSLISLSSPYLSAPVGMESSNWFTNAVGRLETSLPPEELLRLLMEVESAFGRRRDSKIEGYQDRTLDLDILYFGETVMHTEMLTLPHPCLKDRLFVLKPLAEVAPDYHDPADCLTPMEKLEQLERQMTEGHVPEQNISRSEWPRDDV